MTGPQTPDQDREHDGPARPDGRGRGNGAEEACAFNNDTPGVDACAPGGDDTTRHSGAEGVSLGDDDGGGSEAVEANEAADRGTRTAGDGDLKMAADPLGDATAPRWREDLPTPEEVKTDPDCVYNERRLRALARQKVVDLEQYSRLLRELVAAAKRGSGVTRGKLDASVQRAARGIRRQEQADDAEGDGKQSPVDALIRLGRGGADLFHTADGMAHATVAQSGQQQTMRLKSRSFLDRLLFSYFEETGRGATVDAANNALLTLEAIARKQGPERQVYPRVTAKTQLGLTLDNVSDISDSTADALCRLASGALMRRRNFYSLHDEAAIAAKRSVIMTMTKALVLRDDLAERCLFPAHAYIKEEHRRTVEELWTEYLEKWPAFLGCIFDAVSVGLANTHLAPPKKRPRLADLAQWVARCEPALGWAPGTFLNALLSNRVTSAETVGYCNSRYIKPDK